MSGRFLRERRKDRFYHAARREGLRSRAAFKLMAIGDRFPLFREGDRVLDLGGAPGGWSLVARERVGGTGEVVAVDPRRMEPIPGVRYLHGSVGDPDLGRRLAREARFTVVLSDMSPRVSGAYSTDHARSVGLAGDALRLCDTVLASGGTFVVKVFAGDLLSELERDLRERFERVVRTKPPASRERSSELYLLGFGFRRTGATAQ